MTNSEKRKAKADLDRSIAENSKRNREAAARNAEAKANAGLSSTVNVDTGCVREEALKARLDDGTEVPIKMFAAHHRGAVKMFQKKSDANAWLRQARIDWREKHGQLEKQKKICRGIKANADRLSNIYEVYGDDLDEARREHLDAALRHLEAVLNIENFVEYLSR